MPVCSKTSHKACEPPCCSLQACYNEAIIEKPKPHDKDQGWTRNDYGVLEPVQSYGSVLPTSLFDDILDQVDEDAEEEEEVELDFDHFNESDEDW